MGFRGCFRGPPWAVSVGLRGQFRGTSAGFRGFPCLDFFLGIGSKKQTHMFLRRLKNASPQKSRLLVYFFFWLVIFFYCLFATITYCLLPVCFYCLLPICACCLCLVCVAQHQLAPARFRQYFFGSQPLWHVIRVHPCKFVVLVLVDLPFVVPTRSELYGVVRAITGKEHV